MLRPATLIHPTLEQDTNWAHNVWDQAADAMALSDRDGIVLAANAAYYALYGYTPEQVIGQDFAVIFPESQRAWAMGRYRQVFESDEVPDVLESVVRRDDGSLRVVETRISFLTEGGQRVALHSAIRDVTKRKLADRDLLAAKAGAERSAVRTGHLQKLTASLADALTVSGVAAVVLEHARPLLGAGAATLYLSSQDKTEFELIGVTDANDEHWQPWRRLPATPELPMSEAIRRRALLLYPTRESVPVGFRGALVEAPYSEAWALVPFIGQHGAAGGLTLSYAARQYFSEETRELMWALAQQCAQALERAQLYTAAAAADAAKRRIRQAIRAALSVVVRPEDTLRLIAEQSLSVLEGQTAILCLLTGDGESLELIHQAGYEPGVLESSFKLNLAADLPLANVARTGQPYFGDGRAGWMAHFPELARVFARDEAVAVVPMDLEDRRLGVMSIGYAQPQVFGADDRALLLDLGQHYAEALERSRQYALEQQSRSQLELLVQERTAELVNMNNVLSGEIAQRQLTETRLADSLAQLRAFSARLADTREEERQRISRDLHDQLGGALTGLKMDMVRLRKQQVEQYGAASALVAPIVETVDEMTQLVRRIATDLRPPVLDDLGLVAAVEWELGVFQKRSGLSCELQSPDDVEGVSGEVAIAVFRVLQECLTNVARHAHATTVLVTVQNDESMLRLTVQDNGRGLCATQLGSHASLGLLGMRERLRQVGGEFAITGDAENGTRVLVSVPLTNAAAG